MSQDKHPDTFLTRRHWMVLTTLALTGCGGGGGSTALAPGTGGTGVFVQGSISGLGSVHINGIKFDDTLADIKMDGLGATSIDLRLGMVASVQGVRDAVVSTLGTASSVDVWSIAQGPVTQVSASDFTVAGMTIQTNAATLFDGIGSAAALPGTRVVVWGLQGVDANGASLWIATRIAVAPGTAVVSTGLVNAADSQRSLNGWTLTGEAADGLTNGQLVRVQGSVLMSGSSMEVERSQIMGLGVDVHPRGEIEIEGVVTALLSGQHFLLGNTEVDASAVTGYSPARGDRLEVYGSWQTGVLKATKVEVQSEHSLRQLEIEGVIEQFTSVANFVVRGQRCDASPPAILSHGTAANLNVGVKVNLKGTMDGDNILRVDKLEFDD